MQPMQFRTHRGTLEEAMKTLVNLEPTVQALLDHLNAIDPQLYEFKVENMKIKYQGPDRRIGWHESWIIYFEGFGVIGHSDSAPMDTPDYVYDNVQPKQTSDILIRKNIGNFLVSVSGIKPIKPTTTALLEELKGMWGRELLPDHIRIHRRKPDRRIEWASNYAVQVIDGGMPTYLAFIDSLPEDLPHICIPIHSEKVLESGDMVKASAYELSRVPEGQNAYQVDPVRSGVMLSAGWEAMFEMSKPVLDEVVLVNSYTGQRILVKLEAQTHKFD